MGILHDLRSRLAQWRQPKRPPSAQHDLKLLEGLDGCETVYLSLDERHAVDRLVASGHARLEPVVIIGARQFNRLRLNAKAAQP
jgi:hypothetical protein